MLIQVKKKSCCSGCGQGKPCADKPRYVASPSGLLLPDRRLISPRSMLYGTPGELEGVRVSWNRPLLMPTFDMSCLPCCTATCTDCDPATDDPDPLSPLPLDFELTGAITGTGTLLRATCGVGAGWSYQRNGFVLATACGDGGWTTVSICVYCHEATGEVRATLAGGSASCSVDTTLQPITADFWSCNPFTASFTFYTKELFAGGCPCGTGEEISLVVTE